MSKVEFVVIPFVFIAIVAWILLPVILVVLWSVGNIGFKPVVLLLFLISIYTGGSNNE